MNIFVCIKQVPATSQVQVDEETGVPRVDPARCIGCGVCRSVCPADGKAMQVHGVEKQILLNG